MTINVYDEPDIQELAGKSKKFTMTATLVLAEIELVSTYSFVVDFG